VIVAILKFWLVLFLVQSMRLWKWQRLSSWVVKPKVNLARDVFNRIGDAELLHDRRASHRLLFRLMLLGNSHGNAVLQQLLKGIELFVE